MTEHYDGPQAPQSREELSDMLNRANTQLAMMICKKIEVGDIGTASWLKEARAYLKDQGITLSQLPSVPPSSATKLLNSDMKLFTPGVHHHDEP